jgi:hypothetical protein
MSFPVNGSNAQNPFALWQSLLQPDASASNGAQSDPIASLLAALGQGTATAATAPSGGSSSTSSAVTSGSSSPQFGAQTLQAMFDMQANGSNSQSLLSQLGGSGGPDDVNSSPQAPHGHHHHHHTSDAGDGSTAAPTAAALSDGSTSSATANTAGGANVANNNNLLERLIQMQAQLINPATVQNVATA